MLIWYHEFCKDQGNMVSVTSYDANGSQTEYFNDFIWDKNTTRGYSYSSDTGANSGYTEQIGIENGTTSRSHF